MPYFDPLQVDTIFQETIRLITASPSERVQLNLIDRFLEFIEGNEEQFESYLQQILLKLPTLENPLLYAGVRPEIFQGFISKLESCAEVISEAEISDQINSRIRGYKRVLSQIFNWIGESYPDDILNDSLTAFEGNPSGKIPAQVLIPTVEEMDGIYSGRLRKLHVEIISKSENGNQLKAAFGVIGADAGSFTLEAEKAVDALVRETESIKHSWSAAILFEMPHSWHAGKSANLAIAGAFYCEILKAEEQQELFWLNPAACITGEIDESGKVLPVAEGSLNLKVEAAFFSWAHILVVPHQQLEFAQQKIGELNVEFPKRELPIISVTSLKDLFFDRRVTLYNKTDALSHNFKKIWKRKYAAVYVLVLVLLLAVIGILVVGPVDRNPVSYSFQLDKIVIENSIGREITAISIDPYNIENASKSNPGIVHTIIDLVDVDNDGENEILLGLQSDREAQIGTMTLLESNGIDTIWHQKLEFDVFYEKHPYAHYKNYRPMTFQVLDIEGDGDFEILANLQQYQYFKAMVAVIDAKSGEVEQQLHTTGYQSVMLTKDFDKDGILDLLVCGIYKGWEETGCLILGLDNINGFIPMHERYSDPTQIQAPFKLAFTIPYTTVGEIERRIDESTRPYVFVYRAVSTAGRVFTTLSVAETAYLEPDAKAHLVLIFDFDNHFNLIAIGSGDAYDLRAQELFEDDYIDFLADAQYLHSFRDSLNFWNGNDWIEEPTLNPGYLQSIGKDSTYYIEWYFRNND